jgi:hypothetical protein
MGSLISITSRDKQAELDTVEADKSSISGQLDANLLRTKSDKFVAQFHFQGMLRATLESLNFARMFLVQEQRGQPRPRLTS